MRPDQQSETPAGTAGNASQRRQFDANEPALRHAKPRASYVELELEDADLEDLEEGGMEAEYAESRARESAGPEEDTDAAARRARRMPGEPTSSAETPAHGGSVPRRRGRPPKRLSAAGFPAEAASVGAPSTPAGTLRGGKRRRGRPRKSYAELTVVSPANDAGGRGDTDDAEAEDELSLGFASESTARVRPQPAPLAVPQRRRGRPPGVTTIAAASAELKVEAAEDSGLGALPAARASSASRGTASTGRKRGRPKRSGAPPGREAGAPASQQFMSMAERMALRGKKFKIGKKRAAGDGVASTGNASSAAEEAAERSARRPGPGPAAAEGQEEEDEERPGSEGGDDGGRASWTRSTGPSAPWDRGTPEGEREGPDSPQGPTIVRLHDSESGSFSGGAPSSSSATGSGDEGDIPSGRARSLSGLASRPTARGRGRGGARGGARGRPARGRGRMARGRGRPAR